MNERNCLEDSMSSLGDSSLNTQDYFNSSKVETLTKLSVSNEPFFFESDSLALRNNSDYSCLLKTLVLLEGQRIKACNDIEGLIDLKEEALKDPSKFIKELSNGGLTNKVPQRQKLYVLPEIDWDKYYECVDLSDFEAIKSQNNQRVHSLRQSVKLIQQQESQSTRSSSRTKQQEPKKEKEIKNYNKSWSVGEQRQLEELLLEFPPEDNEAQRFRKIANKLGTRTPLQVQSHCQKYFIKLAKAGLPIPGRMPNLKTYVTKKGNRGNRRSSLMRGACNVGVGSGRARPNSGHSDSTGRKMVGRGVSLNEISSMWTSFNPPITMNDDNDGFNDEDDYENFGSNSNEFQSEFDETTCDRFQDNDEDDSESRNELGDDNNSQMSAGSSYYSSNVKSDKFF